MTSDEIERSWKEYSKDFEFPSPMAVLMSKDDFTAGYTQGRADALRWRKYPEEKPKHDTRNAVFYRSTLSKYSENTQLNNHFEFYDWYDNCEKCLELWDHVERFIEVPGGEND